MPTIFPASGHVSFSQISALVPSYDSACALRYAFERRFRLPSQGSLAMVLGSALDDGLNELLRPALLGREPELDRGVAAMWERVEKIPEDLADKEARQKEGAALEVAMGQFHETYTAWHGQDVQFEFRVPYKGETITGIVDRIDADGTIVDHKLSRSQRVKEGKLDPEWMGKRRHQLALYCACVAMAEGQEVGSRTKAAIEVCYVTARLKAPQWTYEEVEIGRDEQVQALEDAITAAFIRDSGYFAASPGAHCQWCSYTAECRSVQSMLALDLQRIAGALE
ncbi:MAG: RecB family exonuclease [Candidatus Dormibacteria bacterium]